MSQRHILLLQILQYDSDCLYISVSNGTCILFHSLLCRLFARCIAIFSFALLILHTPCEKCCVNGTCHNHEGDCNFFLHNLYASFLQHQICVALITASCSSKKLKIRRYYRDAVRASPDKWRKPPSKGGHTEADRQRIYSKWVSRARKKLLSINFGDIWKRHEEVGFIAKCDGSEEMHRDGNRSVLFSVKVYFGIKFM